MAKIRQAKKKFARRTYDVIIIFEACESMKIDLKKAYLNNYNASRLTKRYQAID